MNEFLVSSLIVSIFAFDAFCMNPANWKPPPPEGVQFGECFFVPEITGVGFPNEVHFSYRHICRQIFPEDRPQPPPHERNWYFVGALKSVATPPYYNYVPIRQSLIKFTFLNQLEVKFVSKFTNREFKITFQSVQQRQAFYKLVYRDVILTKATPNKIGALHEIPVRDGAVGSAKKIGNNIDALWEKIDDIWYITLKDDGEPLLIFSQADASLTAMRRSLFNKRQLLMQVQGTFYILTFSDFDEANKFCKALGAHVQLLLVKDIDVNLEAYFKYENHITLDS